MTLQRRGDGAGGGEAISQTRHRPVGDPLRRRTVFRRSFSPVGSEYRGGTANIDRRLPDDAAITTIARRLERYGLRGEARELRLTRFALASSQGPQRREPGPRGPHRSDSRRASSRTRFARSVRMPAPRAAPPASMPRRGLDLLASWQHAFGSIDLQTSASMHAAGLMYRGLASAVDSGRPEIVFDWSERARHMNQQVVPLRPPPDRELADDLAEIRMVRADDPSGDWISSSRVAELRERVRQRQWANTGCARRQQTGVARRGASRAVDIRRSHVLRLHRYDHGGDRRHAGPCANDPGDGMARSRSPHGRPSRRSRHGGVCALRTAAEDRRTDPG